MLTAIAELVSVAAFVTAILGPPWRWMWGATTKRLGRMYVSGPMLIVCSTLSLAIVFSALSQAWNNIALIALGCLTICGAIGVSVNYVFRRYIYPETAYVVVSVSVFSLATGVNLISHLL